IPASVTLCESISGTSVLCGAFPTDDVHSLFTERTGLNPCTSRWTYPDQEKIMEHNAQQAQKENTMEHNTQQPKASTSRRSFLRKGIVAAGTGTIGAGLLAGGLSLPAFAEAGSGGLTSGDAAILRFLAAVEILESDLWQQYNELGGIQIAFENFD